MKAAVESLTKTLALELADRGVRVNCIAADAIPTEGDAGLAEAVHAGGVADYGAKVPLGLGHVDDAAAAAVFLAGDLAALRHGHDDPSRRRHVRGVGLAQGAERQLRALSPARVHGRPRRSRPVLGPERALEVELEQHLVVALDRRAVRGAGPRRSPLARRPRPLGR